MHAAISYYFIQIVDMNRVEMQNICMGLYRNFCRLTQNQFLKLLPYSRVKNPSLPFRVVYSYLQIYRNSNWLKRGKRSMLLS